MSLKKNRRPLEKKLIKRYGNIWMNV